ncbi:MAG: TIR protein [Stygiobacter sp.]|nr:MAG: TIR protein [Stygiobacter sp.]KAF0215783.1 MAG: hypothetical protein FD178_1478 [Ignavibacteria bacterium]
MDREIKYQNAVLMGSIELSSRDGKGCWITVEPDGAELESERLFSEYTFITRTAIRMQYRDAKSELVTSELMDYTLSKAKARIALGLYEMGKEYKQEINSSTLKEELKQVDDSLIQKWILTGLLNIRKKNPLQYQFEEIDINGFCSILGIDEKQYLFNASILLEDDFISEGEPEGLDISTGGIFITSSGIKYLSELINKGKPSPPITEEVTTSGKDKEYDYDVAITFAGENRDIAEALAKGLAQKNIKVFYDAFEQAELWGKNLYDHLSHIYGKAARYCIMLLSKDYADKMWTTLERKSAQARAFREKTEYILPIRLDETEIPGLPETVGYISIKDNSIDNIVELVYKKLIKIS